MSYEEFFADVSIASMISGIFCCSMMFYLLVHVAICYVIYAAANVIPPQHRQIDPSHVWLLLVPLFGAIWGFVVYPKVAASFKAYFEARHVKNVGDCGEAMGLCLAILVVVGVFAQPLSGVFVPLACMMAALPLATLIVLVMYLVKISTLKGQVERAEFVSHPPVALSKDAKS